MKTNVLVTFALTWTLAVTLFYSRLREHFSPVHTLQSQIEALQNRVREERFQRLLLSYQFADFRTEVATVLPGAIKKAGPGEKGYPLRTLASVVQEPSNDQLGFQTAHSVFQDGIREYNKGHYEQANDIFQALIQNHPYSDDVPKAMFLIVNGSFNIGENDQAIDYANQMLSLYPDNELTGYALIRIAKIYEDQGRHQDAANLYQTVMKSFSNPSLVMLAENKFRQEQN